LIASKFDLRKFKKVCNEKKCLKFPSKEVVFFELDLRTLKKKELASAYLCPEHYKPEELKDIVKELNNICEKGKIIDKKAFEIGFVTY
ncbi:MAG: hypothetical protein ISS36_04590, partial [Candidatus Aenigmarchaeota archaeon]|nr:hypothetical protein [Candidatus Aenigmarchaeota archaeon]